MVMIEMRKRRRWRSRECVCKVGTMDQDRTGKQIWTSPRLEALEIRCTAQEPPKGNPLDESQTNPRGNSS